MVLQNRPGESREFLRELFSFQDHLFFPKECIEQGIFSIEEVVVMAFLENHPSTVKHT